MTEVFLIAATLAASLVKGDDRFPALIYCLLSHLLYFLSPFTGNNEQIFVMSAVSEVVLIGALICVNGSLRSKIAFFLIPISALSIIMHFYGWVISTLGLDVENYNSLVLFYWCVIMALFLSRAGGDGDNAWHSRLLRRADSGNKNVDVVSK
jgi:hypothetical protein